MMVVMMGGKMFEFDKPSFYLFICKSAVWIVGFTHGITSRAKYTTRQPLARACQAAKPDERLGVATVRWRRLERKGNIHRGDSARMQSISPPPPPKQMTRMNPYPIPARARLGLAWPRLRSVRLGRPRLSLAWAQPGPYLISIGLAWLGAALLSSARHGLAQSGLA